MSINEYDNHVFLFWHKYDFRPWKKNWKTSLQYFFCLKKVSDLTKSLKWHGHAHMAVADFARFVTWRW